jgi:pyruvate/2-oxoglutarate dehydrogenase complex dihydrolipoamide dehydrogenase (E3) component
MYDLVVLGGGAGALSLATAAARVGARVALVEKARPGGQGTFSGSVPIRALVRAARTLQGIRESGVLGISAVDPQADFAAVMGRVRSVVAQFAADETAETLRGKGIDVICGAPAFEEYDTIVVDGQTRICGHRFVIATGSRPEVPAIPGLAESGHVDCGTIWELVERPETLVVLGAGPVGLELGQAFSRLGTKVTVLAETPRILPREDPEVAAYVQSRLAGEGIAFYTDITVTGVGLQDGHKVVKFRSNTNGDTFEARRKHLLVAAGRRPNVEGLNLDAIGVTLTAGQGIEVDESLQTHARNVFALGDVLGHDDSRHAAEREAAVVFQKAVLGMSKSMDYRTVPRVTFTDPEVASVGPNESELRVGEPGLRTLRVGYDQVDRARIDGRTGGFAKVFTSPGGKILGATIVGEDAAAVLQELVLAMDHEITLGKLLETVHSYPTYGRLVLQLAEEFSATRLEKGLVRTALRWFYGYGRQSEGEPTPGPDDAHPVPAGHSAH